MDARHSGTEIRTRDAIERTNVVVIGKLVEPGFVSPGPPGAHDIDDAGFRVERTLTPAGSVTPSISGAVRVSYTRQVLPQAAAEAPLERGRSYLLFCTVSGPRRLFALKILPHSEEAARVVASAFGGGARHAAGEPSSRIT